MQKLFILIFITCFFTINANAQIRRRTDTTQNFVNNSDKKVQQREMIRSLNLSKEQMGQLKEFRRSMKQKKDDIANDQTLTDEQRQSKMKDLHKEQKEKLNNILTPEQMDKLKEQRKNSELQKGNMNQSDSNNLLIEN